MDGESHQNNLIENIVKTRLDSRRKIISKYIEPFVNSDLTYCGSCYAKSDLLGNESIKSVEDDLKNKKDGICCNSCSSVFAAYSARKQALPRLEDVEQCVREGWSERMKTQAGEGCRATGHFRVDKSSGDFHFAPGQSYDANRAHIHDMRIFEKLEFDFSHHIVSLHFGDPVVHIEKELLENLSQPLKGVNYEATDSIY